MSKRTKEKRFLDEDDLTGIECTFKDIRHELKEIRNELKYNRESSNVRLNSMEKSNDIRYYTLLAVITVSSILLSILKVLF
jgi:hypothetical protein